MNKCCDLCGKEPVRARIGFSIPLSEAERATYRGAKVAELNMLLCQPCGTRTLKHMKRIFMLKDMGLVRRHERERQAHTGALSR